MKWPVYQFRGSIWHLHQRGNVGIAYPFLSYFLNTGIADRGSSSCKKPRDTLLIFLYYKNIILKRFLLDVLKAYLIGCLHPCTNCIHSCPFFKSSLLFLLCSVWFSLNSNGKILSNTILIKSEENGLKYLYFITLSPNLGIYIVGSKMNLTELINEMKNDTTALMLILKLFHIWSILQHFLFIIAKMLWKYAMYNQYK